MASPAYKPYVSRAAAKRQSQIHSPSSSFAGTPNSLNGFDRALSPAPQTQAQPERVHSPPLSVLPQPAVVQQHRQAAAAVPSQSSSPVPREAPPTPTKPSAAAQALNGERGGTPASPSKGKGPAIPAGRGLGTSAAAAATSSTLPQTAALAQPPAGPSRSASTSSFSALTSAVPSQAQSPAFGQPPSRPSSAAAGASVQSSSSAVAAGSSTIARQPTRTPYAPSFQPAGRRRDLTDQFQASRRTKGEQKKLEEGRLERRLEKLLVLHWPEAFGRSSAPSTSEEKRRLPALSGLGSRSALDLWKSVTATKAEAEKAAEQQIVRWADDASAVACAICTAGFGIRARKHHCRLCGRVVCFLPPSSAAAILASLSGGAAEQGQPVRKERCSTFFTYEMGTMNADGEKQTFGRIEEVEIVEPDTSLAGAVASPTTQAAAAQVKDERKKVRVCRDCLHIVLRQQEQSNPTPTPLWLKLYTLLISLEREIEALLPEFQELVVGLSKPALRGTASSSSGAPPSTAAAHTLRKKLLSSLASYDLLSKRIKDLPLPLPSGPNAQAGSQARLQRAIAMRAQLFLTDKLGLLRSLGRQEDARVTREKREKKQDDDMVEQVKVLSLKDLMAQEEQVVSDAKKDGEKEAQLAVLYEQEGLVKQYLDTANGKRQFEDAVSLKTSLEELRSEIARVKAS